ncbi:MAG: DNA alkylation repair protein [Bacteroidetes bacterium]|nr:MAG: DNA alkylation repair protein [Bacteroidota bacterium]
MKTPKYLQPLQLAFRQHANADIAAPMEKYMKDRYEYFGIKSPLRKEIYREHKLKYGLIPPAETEEIIKWCWQQPQREYQYFAMEFLGRAAKKADLDSINLYVYMITNKAWWDTVDFIATNLVGAYLKIFSDMTIDLTGEWMASKDIWLQRTCLLFQLKYKSATDTDLMHGFICQLSGSKEFFIRKAIGWVLREYSKTDAEFVVDYVNKYPISGLSQREALKWLQSRK